MCYYSKISKKKKKRIILKFLSKNLPKNTHTIPKKFQKGLLLYALNLYSGRLCLLPHHYNKHNILNNHKRVFLSLGLAPLAKSYNKHNLTPKDKSILIKHPNLSKNSSFILSRTLSFALRDCKRDLPYFESSSHKDNIAIKVFATFPVGADVEIIKQRDFKPHLDFCFSDFERNFVLKKQNPLHYFYAIWTLKESLLKLENLGFNDLDCVGLNPKGAYTIKNGRKIYHRFITLKRIYKCKQAIITISY